MCYSLCLHFQRWRLTAFANRPALLTVLFRFANLQFFSDTATPLRPFRPQHSLWGRDEKKWRIVLKFSKKDVTLHRSFEHFGNVMPSRQALTAAWSRGWRVCGSLKVEILINIFINLFFQ